MTTAIHRLVTHSGFDEAAVLLDAAGLSTLLGAEVEITHLRIKPGHNLLVAWRRADSGEYGWTEATRDPAKFANACRRAHRLNQSLQVHTDGEVKVFSGPVWADRKLGKALTGLQQKDLRILRYNPQRRLVAQTADERVIRVHADSVAHLSQTSLRWQHLGLPAVSVAGDANLAASPRWGQGDLLTTRSLSGSHLAGKMIARLHARGESRAGELAAVPADPLAAAAAVAEIAPDLAESATRLGQRLAVLLPSLTTTDPTTELHGDLSPDQILVSDTGGEAEIRIIDFDRAGAGPASRDIASYLASCRLAGCEELGEQFLAGYRAAGGRLPWVSVATWQAYAFLTFALTPMRRGRPDWPEHLRHAVTLAEQAVALLPPRRVEIEGRTWLVNRAWADHPEALTLELRHPDTGQLRAGRWDGGGLRACPSGEDPRLALPAGEVVSHRAGKRAVVRATDGESYIKVVRAGRVRNLVAGITRARPFAVGFRMPAVRETGETTVTFAALGGHSLHTPELFTTTQWRQAWREVITGLRQVWDAGGDDSGSAVHTAADEAAVLDTWAARALAFVTDPAGLLEVVAAAKTGLAELPEPELVPCHRDLHGKQLLWTPGEKPALLDVDTACLADRAIDLGNLRAHALWRQRQEVWDQVAARAVIETIDTAGATPATVLAYQRATLARLVCVYAFRPKYHRQAMALLAELQDGASQR